MITVGQNEVTPCSSKPLDTFCKPEHISSVSVKSTPNAPKTHYHYIILQEGHVGPELLTREDLVTINYCAK